MSQPVDAWQSGQAYKQFMGRWSRRLAQEFVQWLPVSDHKHWLDVGCGPGGLSRVILDTKRPQNVLAFDSSPAFLAFARATNDDPRLHFAAGLAQSLPAASSRFDAVICGPVLNFVPAPEQAVAEVRRVAQRGRVG